jgi:hypothetical protein
MGMLVYIEKAVEKYFLKKEMVHMAAIISNNI